MDPERRSDQGVMVVRKAGGSGNAHVRNLHDNAATTGGSWRVRCVSQCQISIEIKKDEEGRSGRCLPLTTTVFWTGAIAIDWEL